MATRLQRLDLLTCFIAQHGKLVKLVVLVEGHAFGTARGVFRAARLSAYVPEERFVGENQFASISLTLGISIAVGRGRAVAARWPLLLAC